MNLVVTRAIIQRTRGSYGPRSRLQHAMKPPKRKSFVGTFWYLPLFFQFVTSWL
ncbi:uncharacterized protein MICPUCDRAFT_64733 [Micromonas pusilla CCMP1545]|uniref:Predicted protein n=1 Tax=Micromonas pusilla (strain CCMP1545) TaxID=564608 RepID=C1ML06_MICPC|nr:uncharacterized protein MICPUCDRAFT_64733 [Micromonas pusilla CCMP1545]EEH59466.1 predicted protein [Micromonas pusilla CCMP1545]|eukprot:XP_003056090.1 predicted protein [Micromonas pusilla CCMP1545]